MPIRTFLFTHTGGGGGGSSHKAKGFNSGMQGGDYGGGIMEVAMLGFDLALIIIVGSSTQLMFVLGQPCSSLIFNIFDN